MKHRPSPALERRLGDFCRARIETAFPPREAQAIAAFLLELARTRRSLPRSGGGFDLVALAQHCGVELGHLTAAKDVLRPGLEALALAFPRRDATPAHSARACAPAPRPPEPEQAAAGVPPSTATDNEPSPPARRRPGRKPRPIVAFPVATEAPWDDPATFHEALQLQLKRHGESANALHRAIIQAGETFDVSTLKSWRRGEAEPRSVAAMTVLARIEQRYRLPAGYFRAKLAHPSRATTGQTMTGIRPSERRRIAWHLPDDFEARPPAEREEILAWVRRVIVSGTTDYRRYQSAATKIRFALRFAGVTLRQPHARAGLARESEEEIDPADPLLAPGTINAPRALLQEMETLVRFKTATLTAVGYQRGGVWNAETASQKVEHLGLLFGALAAAPLGAVRGHGAPLSHLAMAHLAFPAVWDWYVQWRERRRGFYTRWEVDMLNVASALTRKDTGWLRQTPALAERLTPIAGLVSQADIELVQRDWDGACERHHQHCLVRAKEIKRVCRVHRDPFEPILVVLEADSPVAEYRKITDEILRRMPDERRHAIAAAESVRAFLLVRLGLHLGLRQKNLRQLLVCARGAPPTSERRLTDLRRGELRWSDTDNGWEVFIPAVAFKNASSSFFGAKPFRLILPDMAELYGHLDAYISRHRARLLRGAPDPGVLFVKTVGGRCRDAAYDQTTFYEAWRSVIQRHGIFNPYTGRGAIAGLLPHGPHNIRDVLATHILKQTGSYEQASYAIQDTPDMVAQHYGRFLPQDKAAIAAKILNRVWEIA